MKKEDYKDSEEYKTLLNYNAKSNVSEETKSKVTFNFSSIDELEKNADSIHQIMEEYSFVRITGLISADEVEMIKKNISEGFTALGDRASLGEDPKDIQSNFCKLSIGGAQKFGVYRPRCLRTIYNPMWEDDIFGARESFRKMAQVRNVLYGFDQNFAIDEVEDGMWTASRFHQYPAGGGFLISHKDIVVPKVHEKEGYKGFYQLIMAMSKKGVDFETGGGFASIKGEKYYFEEDVEYGDIVIYDGRTVHGVDDIDPHKPFRQTSIDGRIAAFVTLYKDIDKNYKV
ncbi:MAG: hypothetical protein ACI9VT_001395 [Psychroserpens sp.]|jgi:hypothetical protein